MSVMRSVLHVEKGFYPQKRARPYMKRSGMGNSSKRSLKSQSWKERAKRSIPSGCIPRRLRRVRHSGGSRNPEDRTGFRIKCGMTEFKVFDTPLLAAGGVISLFSGGMGKSWG